eukprot:510222_1
MQIKHFMSVCVIQFSLVLFKRTRILARCRIHNEANANKVNNQVHANKRRMQTSDFKGAVLAWAERSVLDGTCKTLKKYRNFLQTNGYLMKYQYDNISDRFKQFEDIRVWLNDWNGSGYSKYRIQFCQNVYLPPAAILKIRTKYQQPKTMTQKERYWFWKHLSLKYTEKSSNTNKEKPNLDGTTQLFCNGRYVKPNTYRYNTMQSKESDTYRMYK